MKSTKKAKSPRIVMLLYSMPPMRMGGAEMQGLELCRHLKEAGIETKLITWGKLWHKRKGKYKEIPFTRIRSLLNLITDIPSLFKQKSLPANSQEKIRYNDKTEVTNQVTGRVGIGMILRYRIFYLNCLAYLWWRRKKFDIIHVHMMEWPAIVGIKLGRKLKKKVVIKDSTMNGILNILRYPNGKNKQQEIAHHACCVAMTKMIHENYLMAGVPENNIADIPNGIEITPIPERKREWSDKVIFVGNLTQQPAKGTDILLMAWKKVIDKVPSATLQIVGEGNLEAYRKFADEIGVLSSVTFLGKQQRVRELLLQADVFVLPSRREGMSNALMEAMLCAMPVVVTNVSGSQDLVEQNISGLLVPPADVEKLSEAIIFMLQHTQQAVQMGQMAYQKVTQKCDMNKVVEQYVQLYHKILQPA